VRQLVCTSMSSADSYRCTIIYNDCANIYTFLMNTTTQLISDCKLLKVNSASKLWSLAPISLENEKCDGIVVVANNCLQLYNCDMNLLCDYSSNLNLLNDLQNAIDEMPDMMKRVTHTNVQQYFDTKEDRIKRDKEKRKTNKKRRVASVDSDTSV
jgi:hypothetical protein